MTYNRDLQEDKERLFDTTDTVRCSVRLTSAMLPSITINQRACHTAANDPALLATDLVDYLVRKGVPFRHAHHVTGRVVALAESHGKRLNELTLNELRSVEEKSKRKSTLYPVPRISFIDWNSSVKLLSLSVSLIGPKRAM